MKFKLFLVSIFAISTIASADVTVLKCNSKARYEADPSGYNVNTAFELNKKDKEKYVFSGDSKIMLNRTSNGFVVLTVLPSYADVQDHGRMNFVLAKHNFTHNFDNETLLKKVVFVGQAPQTAGPISLKEDGIVFIMLDSIKLDHEQEFTVAFDSHLESVQYANNFYTHQEISCKVKTK